MDIQFSRHEVFFISYITDEDNYVFSGGSLKDVKSKIQERLSRIQHTISICHKDLSEYNDLFLKRKKEISLPNIKYNDDEDKYALKSFRQANKIVGINSIYTNMMHLTCRLKENKRQLYILTNMLKKICELEKENPDLTKGIYRFTHEEYIERKEAMTCTTVKELISYFSKRFYIKYENWTEDTYRKINNLLDFYMGGDDTHYSTNNLSESDKFKMLSLMFIDENWKFEEDELRIRYSYKDKYIVCD